jgi:crotonobetainyl-CoA:carnitine CoA-transferase CaiB-like acyl-CoA transferase
MSDSLIQRTWAELGGADAALGRLHPLHAPVPLAARTDVASLAASAVGLATLAAATAAGDREAVLDPHRIAVAYTSERHTRIDGVGPTAFAPLSGFFRTRDGWVRTHANYPWHARVLREALALGPDADRTAATDAFSKVDALAVAEAITTAGGICAVVRDEQPEVDAALRRHPLVVLRRAHQAPATPLPGAGTDLPLRGVRVLDVTRVLAGPVATRTLALLGADVLRVDAPHLPEIGWQHLDTGHGKRSALLDLRLPADRAHFEELASQADVVVLGYRPSGLEALGLSATALAGRHPGIVVAQLAAWGDPDRRGFDSIVQAASGIAKIESVDDEAPGALPAQALDHSAGYLLATAVITALLRRAEEGGSWIAATSLRRVAAELLGMPRTQAPAPPTPDVVDSAPHLQSFEVDGAVITTPAPGVSFEGGPERFPPPRRWGADAATWLPR